MTPSTCPGRKAFVPALFVFLVVLTAGCSTLNRQSVTGQADVELVRELVAPVYSGQQKLVETLGSMPHKLIVFTMEKNRVKQLPDRAAPTRIWGPGNIAFFRVKDPRTPHQTLCYFDPQTLRLLPLPNENTESPPGIGFQTFTLFKAIAHGKKWIPGEQKISLVRMEFKYNREGAIAFVAKEKVRGITGSPYLTAHLRERAMVFFLTRNA